MKARSLLCLGLALALAVSLAACGGKKNEDSSMSSSSMPEVIVSPTPEPMAKAVRVTADDGLNVREAPSTDSEILGLAPNNSRLPLLRETALDGWYQVEFEGETAYVSAEYATMIEVTQAEYDSLRSGSDNTVSAAPGAALGTTTDDGDASASSGDSSDGSDGSTSSADADVSSAPAGLSNQDGE